jgi:hypothetical protein
MNEGCRDDDSCSKLLQNHEDPTTRCAKGQFLEEERNENPQHACDENDEETSDSKADVELAVPESTVDFTCATWAVTEKFVSKQHQG